jgi:hypothetical protein
MPLTLTLAQLDRTISETQSKLAKLEKLRALLTDPEIGYTEPSSNGNSRRSSTKKAPNANGLRSAILDLNFLTPFTVSEVVKTLQNKNFDFDGRDPEHAVRDALYVMAKNRIGVKRTKQGTGGQPSVYEKVAT